MTIHILYTCFCIVPTSSLMLTSSGTSDIVTVGTDIILTGTLVFNLAIVASDVSLLMVDAQLSRDGTILKLSDQGTEIITTNMYKAVDTSNPAAPEYTSTEEAMCATHHPS